MAEPARADPKGEEPAVPVRKIPLASAGVEVTRRSDGSILLRSPDLLQPYPRSFTERFVQRADEIPDRVFMAKRDASGAWRKLTYAQAHQVLIPIAQALLERGLSAERPVAILSENDLEHALIALAALHVGVPYLSISPAYSLVSTDHAKLRSVVEWMTPGLVFASHGQRYARAIAAAVSPETELVVTEAPPGGRPATFFSQLATTRPTEAVERAFRAVGPDTIAKFLLTSGSTGSPKAVIHTQRMLCSNLQMIIQALPFLSEVPPVLVDWLPWNHTFGGNHNFGLVVYNGGSLYLDDGKPVAGEFERTVQNLREIAATVYMNVPRGYEQLVPYLRREPALRKTFFSRLGMLFYAGAGLAQPVWDAMDELATQTMGERIVWMTGLGATETGPSATFTMRGAARAGWIGLPVPGIEVKLAPAAEKLEMRVRGPSVTPGYWRQPELTRAAFDEEGYYKMGDAARFVDPDDPLRGLVFDGRVVEDFKLSSGTWASVGPLRVKFVDRCAPYAQDVVLTGLNREWIGALVFPNVEACRTLCADLPLDAPVRAVVEHPAVRAQFQLKLDQLASEASGSAHRIVRAMLLEAPPSIDANEITDKSSINQRAVLSNRTALVDELYAEPASSRAICVRWKEPSARGEPMIGEERG
jgi:feruloyl-CoA synthase